MSIGGGYGGKGGYMVWECPYCGNINYDENAFCRWCDCDDDINEGMDR